MVPKHLKNRINLNRLIFLAICSITAIKVKYLKYIILIDYVKITKKNILTLKAFIYLVYFLLLKVAKKKLSFVCIISIYLIKFILLYKNM